MNRLVLFSAVFLFSNLAFSNANKASQRPVTEQCAYELESNTSGTCKSIEKKSDSTTTYDQCPSQSKVTITQGKGNDDILGIGATEECNIIEQRFDGTKTLIQIAKMPSGKVTKTVKTIVNGKLTTMSVHTDKGLLDCDVDAATGKWVWCGVNDKFVVDGSYREIKFGGPDSQDMVNLRKGEVDLNDIATSDSGKKRAATPGVH